MNNSKNATDIICEEALAIEFRMTGLLLMFFIITFGVLGNALVCISVIKYSFLRKLSNYFVFSLAVSDIFVSVCVIPFDVIYWIQFPLWTLGSYLCNLWNSLFFLFLTASIFNLLAISVDRFTAVVFPLKYPVFMTLNTTKGIVFTVWIYSSTVGVLLFNLLVPPSGQFYTFELDPNFHAFLLIGKRTLSILCDGITVLKNLHNCTKTRTENCGCVNKPHHIHLEYDYIARVEDCEDSRDCGLLFRNLLASVCDYKC